MTIRRTAVIGFVGSNGIIEAATLEVDEAAAVEIEIVGSAIGLAVVVAVVVAEVVVLVDSTVLARMAVSLVLAVIGGFEGAVFFAAHAA